MKIGEALIARHGHCITKIYFWHICEYALICTLYSLIVCSFHVEQITVAILRGCLCNSFSVKRVKLFFPPSCIIYKSTWQFLHCISFIRKLTILRKYFPLAGVITQLNIIKSVSVKEGQKAWEKVFKNRRERVYQENSFIFSHRKQNKISHKLQRREHDHV